MELQSRSDAIEIVFLLGSQTGNVFSIDSPGVYTIGRDPACDIYITENDVSRYHGRLVWDGAVLTIEDLRSRNGIYLNGEKIVCYKVESGDIIDLGSCTFQISRKQAPAAKASRTSIFRRRKQLAPH
jgi:pSer/pThr/pTyr-binding forkhead associated (FHA) protein